MSLDDSNKNADVCIFCLDDNNTLTKNTHCKCNYYYHATCMTKFNKQECLMCKKNWNVNVKPTNLFKPVSSKSNFSVQYIYLDAAERQRFAEQGHEYLI